MALVLLVWVMAAASLVCAAFCARRWRIGQPASIDWVAGLRALPRRYLVDVHGIVARRPQAARMHALVAGGLLGGTVLLLLMGIVPGLQGVRPCWVLVALLFALGLAGTALVARRRLPRPPAHLTASPLTAGRFQWLPLWLALYLGGGMVFALRHTPLALVPAAIGGAGLVELLRRGPMRHAFAGTVTLIAMPRPRRDTGLRPIDLAAPALGCGTPADFAWNRLASFDACIQCGRCEQACPAFASGQPLNPKQLIQGLVRAIPDPHRPIIGGSIDADALWSCTTCRACVEECPMMIEHVDAIIDLRRDQTLMHGALPPNALAPLRASRYAAERGGHALGGRTDFASGLKLPVLAPGEQTDILLWLGDAAFDLRAARTLRALLQLMTVAGLNYATLGEAETDTGDLARRLGDEATFQSLARDVVATLNSRRFNRIVTADPHALHILRNEYPAMGGHWTVVHHTTLLDELVTDGRLRLEPSDDGIVAYHDPCYLARYNGEIQAPRRLLDAACLARVEIPRHGRQAMCCGGGGGAAISDVSGETRIADLRMGQAAATNAKILAVACPGCTAMLEGVAGAAIEVRDIAELVLTALQKVSKGEPLAEFEAEPQPSL